MHYSELYPNRDANAVPDVGDFVFYRGRMYKVERRVIDWQWNRWEIWNDFTYKWHKIHWDYDLEWTKASGIFYPVTN